MEDNKKVYCKGTNDGKGVIEALKERGGMLETPLFGNSKNLIYYIDPVTNRIISTSKDTSTYNMVISNYTEIQPLKPKRWRAGKGKYYYTVLIIWGEAKVISSIDTDDCTDISRYEKGIYFQSPEAAQPLADKLNETINEFVCSKE